MANVGDIVRFLNTVGGGKVVRVEGNMAFVEDEDGFETPVLQRECVVVSDSKSHIFSTPKAGDEHDGCAQTSAISVAPQPIAEPIEVEETPTGNTINLTLAYEPVDIKAPTSSEIDTVLVNDSNFYVSFCYLTHSIENDEWITRFAGMVEPNIQLLLGELDRSQLNDIDRIAVQYIAFKQDKPFSIQTPGSVEMNFDATKFFKLHCYKPNIYFDGPVIAYELVVDGKMVVEKRVDAKELEKSMRQKIAADRRPSRRPVVKKRRELHINDGKIIVDLHIQELVDNTNGLSPADMLNLQVDEFRRVMDENLKNKGQAIVFIHGKGEGVLRKALTKELNHRYKGHDVQDASFREYGFGATQVTIK